MASTSGPSSTGLIPETLIDDNGNVYIIEKLIASSTEGFAFLARDEKEGQLVVIKQQKISAEPEKEAANKRELMCLAKEGTLIGLKHPSHIIIPFFPGNDFRNVIYELSGEKGKEVVTAKKQLSQADKNTIAYELLKDAFAIQQSNLVHSDLKPNNILVDLNSGTVKIIDMGQAFIAGLKYKITGSEGEQVSPHEQFEGPGFLYMPPESYENEGLQKTINSFNSDLYSIGILIASIYSDQCYELCPYKWQAPVLTAREYLSDILSPELESKEGMPNDLFKIVRHLTQFNLLERPENIACADGVENSEPLSVIYEAFQLADILRQNLLNSANEEGITDYIIMYTLEWFQDLPTIRNIFSELSYDEDLTPVEKTFLKTSIQVIDEFCQQIVDKIHRDRTRKVLEATKYERTVEDTIKELQSMAQENRKPDKRGLLLSSKKIKYNPIGKALLATVETLKSDPQYPNIPLTSMIDSLEVLYGQILSAKTKDSTIQQKIISSLHETIRSLKDASPEPKTPRKTL